MIESIQKVNILYKVEQYKINHIKIKKWHFFNSVLKGIVEGNKLKEGIGIIKKNKQKLVVKLEDIEHR